MKSKHDVNVKNGTFGKYPPKDVIIIGHDTEDKADHPLCDVASNERTIPAGHVAYAKAHGIKDVCLGVRDGARVLIVAGRSRTRALRIANEELTAEGQHEHLLPVLVLKGAYDDPEILKTRVMENWLRRDLTPVDKAREAHILLDKEAMTKEELCEYMGVKMPRLNEILGYVNFSRPVQNAIADGKIAASACASWSKLPVAEQNEQLAKVLRDGGPKVTKERVRAASGAAPVQTPKVRLARAAAALRTIAGDLNAALGDDSPLWGSLSTISDALTGKSWNELMSPEPDDDAPDDVQPFEL